MEINIEEKEKNKKNKISYDDLLSNMGFKLNNGKLELYNKKINQEQQINNVKIEQQQAQPMTKEQYKRLLKLQYIQKLKERERINNIKSKKLLFSNPLSINNMNKSIIDSNKLFNFSR